MKPGPEADAIYLRHMLECIERVEEYVAGDELRFRTSPLVQDAVIRNLQTLAESSQRLSDAIKNSEPDTPWLNLGFPQHPGARLPRGRPGCRLAGGEARAAAIAGRARPDGNVPARPQVNPFPVAPVSQRVKLSKPKG